MKPRVRTLRRWLILVAGVLALSVAGCGSSETPPPDSGIQGTVTLGPNCPVVQVGQPCPDTPYEAELVITTSSGKEVARTGSGADGQYRVELEPGDYIVVPQSAPGSQLPFASPIAVTVLAESFSVVDIGYDSGIR